MQLTVHVPDDMIEAVKSKLPPPEAGVLEAVALDAVLGFLMKLEDSTATGEKPNSLSQLLNFIFRLQEKRSSSALNAFGNPLWW